MVNDYEKWSHFFLIFMKNDLTWMDHWLVLISLKIADFKFLVTIDNDVSCHMTLGDFQKWPWGGKCYLTYQCSIYSEKTNVNQFARLCRTNCLLKFLSWWHMNFGVIILLKWRNVILDLLLCQGHIMSAVIFASYVILDGKPLCKWKRLG